MTEEQEIDLTEARKKLFSLLSKLELKDFIIIILLLLLILFYIVHTKDIEKCNIYYQGIITDMQFNFTTLW